MERALAYAAEQRPGWVDEFDDGPPGMIIGSWHLEDLAAQVGMC